MPYPTDSNDTVVYNGVDLYIPKDCSCTVFEDSRVFLFGEWYLNGQPIMVGSGSVSGSEVYVGITEPSDPGILLWFDTSAGYGELKVRSGGTFKTVEDPVDSQTADEVSIGVGQPVATNYELWVDTTSAPENLKAKVAGSWKSINNEVVISGTEPPDPNVELWIDTATAAPVFSQTYISPGNAIGVVAVGSVIQGDPYNIPSNTYTKITSDIVFTPIVGRKYRVILTIPAVGSIGPETDIPLSFKLRNSTTPFPYDYTMWINGLKTAQDFATLTWVFNGDGAVKTLNVALNPLPTSTLGAQLYTQYNAQFYVEDIGPNANPVLPVPTPDPPWTAASPFTNSYTNLAGGQPLQYRKVGDEVFIRGAIKPGTVGASCFTLPAGFRPPNNMTFPVGGTMTAASAVLLPSITINAAAGTMIPADMTTAFVHLGTLRFSTT